MKIKEAASLFVASLISVILFTSANAKAAVDLESDYLNKVLTLRHFYKGDHLSFAADGTLVGAAEVGPWTVDGEVQVQNIELAGQSLHITGRRVCVVFDKKNQPYRDVVELIDEEAKDPEERKKAEDVFLNRTVTIEIALDSGQPEDAASKAAMEAVFVKPGESLASVMPDYWQGYFEKADEPPNSAQHSAHPVYRVGGGVSPPRVVYQPEPAFSEDARRAKYQGTVTLALVVDISGKPRDLRIMTPLGLGLDEKAVDAIRTWKFDPAQKSGQPVPVVIAVEVDFHLY